MDMKERTVMVNTIMVITKNMEKKQTNTTNLIMLIKVVNTMENIIKVITKNMHKEKKLMLSTTMIMIMKWMMKMTIIVIGYGYFLLVDSYLVLLVATERKEACVQVAQEETNMKDSTLMISVMLKRFNQDLKSLLLNQFNNSHKVS